MARTRAGRPTPLSAPRDTVRAVATTTAGHVRTTVNRARARVARAGFPYRAPSTPGGVERLPEVDRLGANFDTDFARNPASRAVRRVVTAGPLRALVHGLASPSVHGLDRLEDLRRADPVEPLIFAPNHHSHLDTGLMIRSIPEPWRSRLVIAAAADYFFDTRLKGTAAALALNVIPIDRTEVGRRSSDRIRDLIDDGWSLVIFPEGGRSPDGWGQPFKGGAAYLAARTDTAVVPVFIDGTGAIYGKGMKRPRRGTSRVTFGAPMQPGEAESTRRFNARIEAAVTLLADESVTDYWTARRRAALGTSPALTGPEYTGWRRQWALSGTRKTASVGLRRRQRRRWPDLG